MQAISLELPDKLAEEVDRAVQAGWFADREEAICEALRQFLNARRLELQEQHQLDDIQWALRKASR